MSNWLTSKLYLCQGVSIGKFPQYTGIDSIMVKWPNDLLSGKKEGGMLTEAPLTVIK